MMQWAKPALMLLFILTYVIRSFFPIAFLSYVMDGIVILVFCIGLPDIKPLNRNLIILLLVSSGLLIGLDTSRSFDWALAIIENAGIVTLLLTVPMLGVILKYAPYESVTLAIANQYITTTYRFYLIALGITAFLGSLMSVAALPFVYQLLKPISRQYPSEALHKALTRGFAVNLFWAPSLISVAVVLRYVHISWQELATVGLGFSFFTLIVAVLVGKYELRYDRSSTWPEGEIDGQADSVTRQASKQHIVSLLVQVAIILGALVALSYYGQKNIYVTVAIIAVIMPLLIALPLGKVRIYRQMFNKYCTTVLPGMSNEFMIFLTIGFFGYVLGNSSIITFLQAKIVAISGFSTDALVLCIIFTIMALAIIGLHPIITISSLAIALGKIDTGLSNLQLAITFIAGYIMYLTLSPFSSGVMIMSGLSKENVYKVGLKLNWLFAVVLTSLIVCIMHVWITS